MIGFDGHHIKAHIFPFQAVLLHVHEGRVHQAFAFGGSDGIECGGPSGAGAGFDFYKNPVVFMPANKIDFAPFLSGNGAPPRASPRSVKIAGGLFFAPVPQRLGG